LSTCEAVAVGAKKDWRKRPASQLRTIQNLEGGRPIHPATVAKVAQALGVPPAECIASPTALQQPQNGHAFKAVESVPPCPYRGLLAFREEDAEIFFGHEALIDLLTEKLAYKSVIQVSGCSGSGKSSLILAGVIPALKRAGDWQVLCCRPGSDSFGAVASALIPQLEPQSDEITRAGQLSRLREVLEQGELVYLLAQIGRNSAQNTLLFIDQLEGCTPTAIANGFGIVSSTRSFLLRPPVPL
jgi:hypothetical protein